MLLFALFAGLSRSMVQRVALTDDEPSFIFSGLMAWENDYGWYIEVPALARMISALPLLSPPLWKDKNHPLLRAGHIGVGSHFFLSYNRISRDAIMHQARAMMAGLAAFGGFGLYVWTFGVLGPAAAAAALAFFVLNPIILGHAILAKADMAMAVFLLWSLWAMDQGRERSGWWYPLGAGAAFGAALASKYFAVLFLPVYGIGVFLEHLLGRTRPWKNQLLRAGLFVLGAAALVLLVYKVQFIHWFIEGVRYGSKIQSSAGVGIIHGEQNASAAYYYLLTLFVKTPLALLIITALGLLALCLKRKDILPMLWPTLAFVFFGGAMLTLVHFQSGVRQLLPLFMVMPMIGVYGLMQLPRKIGVGVGAVLLAWMGVAVAKVHPWEFDYFNETIGGSSQGHRYFTQVNIDWGIGFLDMVDQFKKRGIKQVYLGYIGHDDPLFRGLHAYPLTPLVADWERFVGMPPNKSRLDTYRSVDLRKEKRAYMAAQAESIFQKEAFLSWLAPKKPAFVSAYSYFAYDITDDADAHRHLTRFFTQKGDLERARIHSDWAKRLSN